MAQRIDPVFEAWLAQRPQELVRLIVRVRGDMAPALARLNQLGCTVTQRYQIIPAVAVSCSGEKALALSSEPWVSSLEEDRRLSTQVHEHAGQD